MKRCRRCGVEKPLTDFHRWYRGDGYLWCKPCRKEYDSEYHARNRKRREEQVKERRRRLHEWNNALKSSMTCVDCGQFFHPVAMTWDHLPGRRKVTEVSNLVRAGKKIQARKEIEKCELVCANCHAVRSYTRLGA